MKRPMAIIGFTMLASAVLLCNIEIKATFVMMIVTTVAFCVLICFKFIREKMKILLFVLTAVAIFFTSLFITQYDIYKLQKYVDVSVKVKGVVCEVPKQTDYSLVYTVKVTEIDGKSADYKVYYISSQNMAWQTGDIVEGRLCQQLYSKQGESLEYGLAKKIYFTCVERNNKSCLNVTGEKNFVYSNIGRIKNAFVNSTMKFLPNESGVVANAMTVGTKSDISDYTMNTFNYAGTAHLLVVSGLHITLWTYALVNLLNRSAKLRKFRTAVGVLWIIFYSCITGFSPSVVRAGTMTTIMLLANSDKRDSDSINSIGLAVAVILVSNPYSVYSASMWLSVLSSLGIIVLNDKIRDFILHLPYAEKIIDNAVVNFLVSSVTVSVSSTVFTLPVFIMKFSTVSVVSIISNIVMVDLSMVLMILTVVGFLLNIFHIPLLTNGIYVLAGGISKFLIWFANTIGMKKWSTVSVAYVQFKYFLVVALIGVLIAVTLKKLNINILRGMCVTLSVILVCITLYCTSYEYNTLSVDAFQVNGKTALLINFEGNNILIGDVNPKDIYKLKETLNYHNGKSIDSIFLTENSADSRKNISKITNALGETKVYYLSNSGQTKDCGDSFCLSGNIFVNSFYNGACIEISQNGKSLILLKDEYAENLLEIGKRYDIIILYSDNSTAKENSVKNLLKDSQSQIYILYDGLSVEIYFEQEKFKWH